MLKKRKALTPLQKLKASQKPKRKTIPQLVKEADMWFSKYVRLRDSAYRKGVWECECISCNRKLETVHADGRWNPAVNAGHYISRGHKLLRWSDENVNAQCARCNAWADKVWMIQHYRKNLCLKIGEAGVEDLEVQSSVIWRPKRADLEEIIREHKEWVSFTLAHPEGIK